MTYENLLQSVEENAEKKIRDLKERSEKAAADIRADAEQRAREIEDACLAEAKEAALVERNRLMFIAQAENNTNLIEIRSRVCREVFAEAEKALRGTRDTPRYPEIFRFLAREAAGAAGADKLEFHIDRRDEEVCKKVLGELKLTGAIKPDLSTLGGLTVSTPDGGITIHNTFESRLERAKDLLKLEIYATLYGGKS